jgi:translation initiation factor 2 subunit 2
MDNDENELNIALVLPKRKRKKKKPKSDNAVPVENADYSYMYLLHRLYTLYQEEYPKKTETKRLSLPPPRLARAGRKTHWVNFRETCHRLGRELEHVQRFILTEFGTVGTLKENGVLSSKGRFREAQLHSLLNKYVQEYVRCGNCKGCDTVLTKDTVTRLQFLECVCGSRRCVVKK